MRRITAILLLLGILLAVGIVGAQEEEIVVSYYIKDVIDITPHLAQSFLEYVQTQLLNYDTSITIVQHSNYDDIPESTVVDISFESYLGAGGSLDYTVVSIWSTTQILETISPILESSVHVIFILSEENAPEITSAVILYTLGRSQGAHNVFNDIAPRDDIIYEAMIDYLRGNIEISLSNYELAISYLDLATEAFVRGSFFYPEPFVNLAWLHLTNGESETGIELLNEYEDYAWEYGMGGEGLSFIWVKRAQLYALTFAYDKAIIDIDRAISYWESYCTDNTLLTGVYTQEMYCTNLNTRLAELYTIRGQIVFLLYEWDRVLADFNHAIELDSNYAPAYFERGVLYYTMTQRENALADFEHYLELEPDGLYAEEAAQYIESIQIELEALGG